MKFLIGVAVVLSGVWIGLFASLQLMYGLTPKFAADSGYTYQQSIDFGDGTAVLPTYNPQQPGGGLEANPAKIQPADFKLQ